MEGHGGGGDVVTVGHRDATDIIFLEGSQQTHTHKRMSLVRLFQTTTLYVHEEFACTVQVLLDALVSHRTTDGLASGAALLPV